MDLKSKGEAMDDGKIETKEITLNRREGILKKGQKDKGYGGEGWGMSHLWGRTAGGGGSEKKEVSEKAH